ncbi:type 1 fimbrial protein [Providencia rettgeri]
MKLNKLALVLGLGLAVVAGSASADQGSGVITFKGSIIDAPCSIPADSLAFEVPMGAISSVALNGGGKGIESSFKIELKQCDITTLKSVQTTFTGTPSTSVTDGLAIVGTAKNAGIVITDANGDTIKLGEKSPSQMLFTGDNTLNFKAYLQGDSDQAKPVVPGEFTAVATFALSYQ